MVEDPSNEPKLKVRDYWPLVWRHSVIITILMEVVLTLIVAFALLFAGFNFSSFGFILIIITVIVTSIGVNILLLGVVMQPLRDLSAALTHASGEVSDVQPPNPMARRYHFEGLQPLLQLIYTMSTASHTSSSSPAKSVPNNIERALDQSSAGIIICDETGAVTYASRHAPIAEGTDGSPRIQLLFEKEAEFEIWLEDCRHRQVHSEHVWLRVPDQILGHEDRRIYDITATYEKDSTAPVVLAAFDRTDYYQPEDDQLDFISFAAHELRGPVTVIRGYLDVFKEELGQPNASAAEQQALLSRLIVSANRLSGYISNILNSSRYDRRHLNLHLREQHVDQIYAGITDDMSLRASTQSRLLSVQIPPDLPTVAADTSSISEALSNLIDNAIKYSNEGGQVSVTASVEGDFVRVNVTDQGIGMPSNVVSSLFHKFYRSHRSRETVAGTGIGLYITKAIIESHGGTIEVKSEEGRGSTFSFLLPIYATVADKLAQSGNSNKAVVRTEQNGWIKNHTKIRG